MNEMIYKNAWTTKRNLHEDINVGYVDIYTPEGELLKHTFDVETVPKAFLVHAGGVVEMPSISEIGKDWSAHDMELFVEHGYRQVKDKLPLRKSVREGMSLIQEYVISFLQENHFNDILQITIQLNNLSEQYLGYKHNFKRMCGENFGKKKKHQRH
jgi:hypothetical protein